MFNPPKLIGHRGVRELSPENTLNSIKLAKQIGLSWVEVDVKITKDQVPILLHDDTLDRTTNGRGFPLDYNYSEIKKLDAGYYFFNYTTDIIIPTLKDVLLFCSNNNFGINIELKPNKGFENKNIEAVAENMYNSNLNFEYFFSSFDLNSLIKMKKKLPEAHFGILIDNFKNDISLENILNICTRYKFSCCGFNKEIINREIINKLTDYNIFSTVYGNKNINLKEAKQLWKMGVKSIFTDDPREFY